MVVGLTAENAGTEMLAMSQWHISLLDGFLRERASGSVRAKVRERVPGEVKFVRVMLREVGGSETSEVETFVPYRMDVVKLYEG